MSQKLFKILFLFNLIFLTSCYSFVDYYSTKPTENCQETKAELDKRYKLFKKLSKDEIKKRKKTEAPSFSSFDQISVFTKIIEAINNAETNAKFIAVDLRYYKNVSLGNIITSNLEPKDLKLFMKHHKYHNDSYAAINLNCNKVTLSPSQKNKLFEYSHIKRSDLSEAEIVINISDVKHVEGNMKFSSSQKVSIIADRIHDSYGIDLSKDSNMSSLLNKKWIMSIYGLENGDKTNKKNQGFFRFIDNNNAKIDFDKSLNTCNTIFHS
jgi:hypothetical protein